MTRSMKTPIILASQSKVRAQMLLDAGLEFEIRPSPYDEEAHKAELSHLHPKDKSLALAKGKAEAVSRIYQSDYVIGADQICAMGDFIFGKPKTHARAKETLQQLRGNMHHQYSGACVYFGGECVWEEVEVVELHMHKLSDDQIEDYIAQDEPFAACGAYRYEAHGHELLSNVHGSAAAIKGLPLEGLLRFLND